MTIKYNVWSLDTGLKKKAIKQPNCPSADRQTKCGISISYHRIQPEEGIHPTT